MKIDENDNKQNISISLPEEKQNNQNNQIELKTTEKFQQYKEKEKENLLESENKDSNYQTLSNENSQNPQKKFYSNINEIIDRGGYNFKTYQIIFFTYIFYWIDGFFFNFFNIIANSFKEYHKISSMTLSIISSLMYISMIFGNCLMPTIKRLFSRKTLLVLSSFMLLVSHIIYSLVKNIYVFCIFRSIFAIFYGSNIILIYNIMIEYLPLKLRSMVSMSIWLPSASGLLSFIYICKYYNPDLNYIEGRKDVPQDFYYAVYLFTYILALNFIVNSCFIEDSPRNLILNGERKKAKGILDYYVGRKLTEEEIISIENNVLNSGENKHYKTNNGFDELFTKRMAVITILLMLVYFFVFIAFAGIYIVFPVVVVKEKEIINFGKEKINTLLVFATGKLIGAFCGMFISEFKCLPYKFLLIVFLIFSFIFGICGLIFIKHFSILTIISIVFVYLSKNLMYAWTGEILPTKLRDNGFSLLMLTGRTGGIFSQIILVNVVYFNYKLAIVIYLVMLTLSILLIVILPKNDIQDLDSSIEVIDSEKELHKSVYSSLPDNTKG